MGKIIISSRAMLRFLDKKIKDIQSHEWCPVLIKNHEFYIDGRKGSVTCHAQKDFAANPKSQSVIKLWMFLDILEDQPITLHFDENNWIYIKDACF